MIDPADLRAYLRRCYVPARFERRDAECPGYSESVVQMHLRALDERGHSLISRHESATGEAFRFGREQIASFAREGES